MAKWHGLVCCESFPTTAVCSVSAALGEGGLHLWCLPSAYSNMSFGVSVLVQARANFRGGVAVSSFKVMIRENHSPAPGTGLSPFNSTCPPLIHCSRTTQAGTPLKHGGVQHPKTPPLPKYKSTTRNLLVSLKRGFHICHAL